MNEHAIRQSDNGFYIESENGERSAEITFADRDENVIEVDHTFVDPSLRGQGVAGKLLNKVVEYARDTNKKIIPVCSYAQAKMLRNKEYEDVLAEQ